MKTFVEGCETLWTRHIDAKDNIRQIAEVLLHEDKINQGVFNMIERNLDRIQDDYLSILSDFGGKTFEAELNNGDKYKIEIIKTKIK